MPGPQCTRSLVCANCELNMHISIHSGGSGNIRHSPRDGFTVSSALSRGMPHEPPIGTVVPNSVDAHEGCQIQNGSPDGMWVARRAGRFANNDVCSFKSSL